MHDETRAAIADLALCGAAAIAVYLVVRNPPLRRAVWHLARYAVLTAGPTWLWQETRRAWAESAQTIHESRVRNQE